MTKEEILIKHVENLKLAENNIIQATDALKAMDEYAKELFISIVDIMSYEDYIEMNNGFAERVYDRLIKKIKS